MTPVFLGLGSNIGDREAQIGLAVEELSRHPEIVLRRTSALYETEPVGYKAQPPFLNAVAELDTRLTAFELLETALAIEAKMGRKRQIHWGPRTIDLDILLYDNARIQSASLIVPHPRLQDRKFVLIPLMELAPDLLVPGTNKRIRDLLDCCPDTAAVRRYQPEV